MPELLLTLEAMHKDQDEERKFLAQIQGVEMKEEVSEELPSFEDIQMKALGLSTDIKNDVIGLRGSAAAEKGFGINQGLGYSEE